VSKAFKGEDASEAPLVVPPRAPLPPGVENYVTASGLAALKAERERLVVERARIEAAGGEDADRPRALAAMAERIAAVEDRLATARLVDARTQPAGEVRFGATVTVRAESGEERRYRIVGVDEADVGRGAIAFVAPLAKALLGKRVGEAAVMKTPRGEEELEVLRVLYEADA
jgi:transcription elongation factor GreB